MGEDAEALGQPVRMLVGGVIAEEGAVARDQAGRVLSVA